MEKIKLLLYCTKGKPLLYKGITAYTRSVEYVLDKEQYLFGKIETLNGKIVAECDFEVEEITPYQFQLVKDEICVGYETKTTSYSDLMGEAKINWYELDNYLKANIGYAIHIKNLNIFDKSREISEYGTETSPISMKPICYAPQNMMRCIDAYDNQYILISIRPEWLCKILNGEKAIEVRKKVLKEMVK